MINARPGYWDIDSCSWVGAEPMYVVPPLAFDLRREAPAREVPEASAPGVPGPRHRRGEDAETASTGG